jgi:uncharacterized protein
MLYLITFIIIVLAIAGMAVGVIFGRPAIRGSCGGIAGECSRCTVKCRQREGSL